MKPTLIEGVGSALFAIALLHTFLIGKIQKLASHFSFSSISAHFFHYLGEVEIVIGFWAGIFICILFLLYGHNFTLQYIEHFQFTEPLFVFVILAIAATHPILDFTARIIHTLARFLPLRLEIAAFFSCLVWGPLLGSVITEPAAMTVTALLLKNLYFSKNISHRLKYATLAVLFVNISIGGVLTPFAAPPVLMVAKIWNWDLVLMIKNFGWKSLIAVILNTTLLCLIFSKELKKINLDQWKFQSIPKWLSLAHLFFLIWTIIHAHHPKIFIPSFIFFIGLVSLTQKYQEKIKFQESLKVAFFLGGLMILGESQQWWLSPLIKGLNSFSLFIGTTFLTAITDNAALTYLGAQVPNVPFAFQYALVAGAISGGGLTLIANAPNLIGCSILKRYFPSHRIEPLMLLQFALIPTLISLCCFWLL